MLCRNNSIINYFFKIYALVKLIDNFKQKKYIKLIRLAPLSIKKH